VVFGEEESGFDRVVSDHEAGAYQLARWLIGQGRRRILFLQPENIDRLWLLHRYQGYARALSEDGLVVQAPLVYAIPELRWSAGRENADEAQAWARLLSHELKPHLRGAHGADALMVISDGDVSRVAQACRLCGKEPNGDVALVGYDNYWRDSMELSPVPFAPLATVDKRNKELGAALVQLLEQRLAGNLPRPAQTKVVAPQLVVI